MRSIVFHPRIKDLEANELRDYYERFMGKFNIRVSDISCLFLSNDNGTTHLDYRSFHLCYFKTLY